MSIQLIYGKSGSGKSEYILNEIKEKSNLDKKIYVITPEQFSYATEKKLLKTIGKNASINAEVISFDRIARRMLSELRWKNKNRIVRKWKSNASV